MKLMIASDLHGVAFRAEQLLAAFEREQADRLLLLGDLLYHGPRNGVPEGYDPVRVSELLNGFKDRILCVRGNCDGEVDQMLLEFPLLAEYALLSVDGVDIFATHGHKSGPANVPPVPDGSVLACGHTHLPIRRAIGGITFVNPGSVSLPKQDTPNSYLTLENGVFTWHHLESGESFEPLN